MFDSCLIASCGVLYLCLMEVITLDSGSMSGKIIGSCLLSTGVTCEGSLGGVVGECLDDSGAFGKGLVNDITSSRGSSDSGTVDSGLSDCDTAGVGLYDVVCVVAKMGM